MFVAQYSLSGIEDIADQSFCGGKLSLSPRLIVCLVHTKIHAQLVAGHESVWMVHPEESFPLNEDLD